MLAYFGIARYSNFTNKETVEAIAQQLKNAGVDTMILDRDVLQWGDEVVSLEELTKIRFRQIARSDFVVLDMSVAQTEISIDFGYAKALAKPILILVNEGVSLDPTVMASSSHCLHYSKPSKIEKLISTHWFE